jgi:hypothetical protein
MVFGLSYLIQDAYRWCQEHQALLQLLPEKNYGIFLADERGDIGVVFQVKAGKVNVSFPRKQVDGLSQFDYLGRRLAEFKRQSHLHITLGCRLKRFLGDTLSSSVGKEFWARWGTEYLLAESNDSYKWLGGAFQGSRKNLFLFLDLSQKVAFGVRCTHNRIGMLPDTFIEMANLLLDQAESPKEAAAMLRSASNGVEEAVFVKIVTVKRVLEGMLAPSKIQKIVLRLLERAMESKASEDKG